MFMAYPNCNSVLYQEWYGIWGGRDGGAGHAEVQGAPEFVRVLVNMGWLDEWENWQRRLCRRW